MNLKQTAIVPSNITTILLFRKYYMFRSKNPIIFFHWYYSPLWALDCRIISFHFVLSATNFLQLLTLSTWRSLSTPLSILSWVVPFSSLPVLEWRSFCAPYPPPSSPGDLTNLPLALLSILLYFLLCSSLLILDSSYFSIKKTIIKAPLQKI